MGCPAFRAAKAPGWVERAAVVHATQVATQDGRGQPIPQLPQSTRAYTTTRLIAGRAIVLLDSPLNRLNQQLGFVDYPFVLEEFCGVQTE